MSIISTQTSLAVMRRYRNAKMLVMTGTRANDNVTDTFAFFRDVVGFALDEFFERHSAVMRKRCIAVLSQLLTPT
jgi:hypothetical protein